MHRVTFLTSLIVCIFVVMVSQSLCPPQATALTVKSYCQATISFLQASAATWQAKTDLLQRNYKDPKRFQALEQALILRQDAKLDSLFKSYSTTKVDFFKFGRIRRAEIARYLDENLEVRQVTEDSKVQNEKAARAYEVLLATYKIRGGTKPIEEPTGLSR